VTPEERVVRWADFERVRAALWYIDAPVGLDATSRPSERSRGIEALNRIQRQAEATAAVVRAARKWQITLDQDDPFEHDDAVRALEDALSALDQAGEKP